MNISLLIIAGANVTFDPMVAIQRCADLKLFAASEQKGQLIYYGL